jgi:hypothetical protein
MYSELDNYKTSSQGRGVTLNNFTLLYAYSLFHFVDSSTENENTLDPNATLITWDAMTKMSKKLSQVTTAML